MRTRRRRRLNFAVAARAGEIRGRRGGQGRRIAPGTLATTHFECKFRGLTVSSTREARTLGGNRTISEPFQFKYRTPSNEFTKAAKRKNVIGVGIEVRIDPDLKELYVVKCVFNGPADRAGIQPNDVIVATAASTTSSTNLSRILELSSSATSAPNSSCK